MITLKQFAMKVPPFLLSYFVKNWANEKNLSFKLLSFYSYFITDNMVRIYNNKIFKIIIKTNENLNHNTVKLAHPSNSIFIPLDVYSAGSLDLYH